MTRPGPLWPDESDTDLTVMDAAIESTMDVETALAHDPRRTDLSVVIPLVGDDDDPSSVVEALVGQLDRLGLGFEILLVVDGPRARALAAARRVARRLGPCTRVLQLTRALGEASALSAGFERSHGEMVLTSACFLQVRLENLDRAITPVLRGEADLVTVRRSPRAGSPLARLRSWLFHWLARRLTATPFHDLTGNLRVMKRRVTRQIDLYGDLHRFLPVLALELGFEVLEISLPQHEDDRRHHRPGPSAYPRRILDLLTIFFLSRFTQKPLRFFGSIGLTLAGVGGSICVYLALYKLLDFGGISDRPMLLLGMLMVVLGVQSIGIGLLGEIIIFTHSRRFRGYRVREVLGTDAVPDEPNPVTAGNEADEILRENRHVS